MIQTIHNQIITKDKSVSKIVSEYFDRIDKTEEKFNSFITIDKDNALKKAKRADDKISKLSKSELEGLPLLFGVPYSAKDLYLTKGLLTTGATKILGNFIPPYSATVINKLEKQGAIIVGKANHDPFGFGSSTENSDYGVSKNAYNTEYVSGGSSGGSAASVALETSVFSMGTDTGGSCRQPASFNNVVGLKPTYGRVSRYGVIAYASSLDSMGHITKTVNDCAIVLTATAGKDPHDATSSNFQVDNYLQEMNKEVKTFTLGIAKEFFENEGLDDEVKKVFEESVKLYKKLGAKIVEVSLPTIDHATSIYYILSTAEASSNLARYDGIRFGHSNRSKEKFEDIYDLTRKEGFNDEIKRRIILGTYELSAAYYDAYYKKALKMRTLVIEDYNKAFEKADALISPVFPTPPFKIGAFTNDPIKLWLSDIFTVTTNVFGGPAISIPAGFTKDKLPIGVQLTGPHFSESMLFRLAKLFEDETEYYKNRPPAIN